MRNFIVQCVVVLLFFGTRRSEAKYAITESYGAGTSCTGAAPEIVTSIQESICVSRTIRTCGPVSYSLEVYSDDNCTQKTLTVPVPFGCIQTTIRINNYCSDTPQSITNYPNIISLVYSSSCITQSSPYLQVVGKEGNCLATLSASGGTVYDKFRCTGTDISVAQGCTDSSCTQGCTDSTAVSAICLAGLNATCSINAGASSTTSSKSSDVPQLFCCASVFLLVLVVTMLVSLL